MFQFSGFPSIHYEFMYRYTGITLYEFPHSDIFGSKVACTSPKLIAAYHVLHRLLAPRHPPYALNNLTYINQYLLRHSLLSSALIQLRTIVRAFTRLFARLDCLVNLGFSLWDSHPLSAFAVFKSIDDFAINLRIVVKNNRYF